MIIIGFGHESRTGKDTAASFLAGHIRATKKRCTVNKTGFASKIKAMCHDLYRWAGMRDEEFYEQEENAKFREIPLPILGKTPVQIWIELGTTVGRAIYSETWVEYPFDRYKDSTHLIFKDVRFQNEIDAIRRRCGHVFKIINERVPKKDSVVDNELRGKDCWDGIIHNNGTLKEFGDAVIQSCGHLLGEQP